MRERNLRYKAESLNHTNNHENMIDRMKKLERKYINYDRDSPNYNKDQLKKKLMKNHNNIVGLKMRKEMEQMIQQNQSAEKKEVMKAIK